MEQSKTKRRHYIYLSVPLRGHVDPVLPLLKSLTGTGDTVTVFGYDSMRGLAFSAGARFEPYDVQTTSFDQDALEHFCSIFNTLMDFTADNMDNLVRRLGDLSPDCIIHDQFCPWAKFAAWALRIPAVCTSITLIMEKGNDATSAPIISQLADMHDANIIRASVQERLGAPKWGIIDSLQNKEGLNLVLRMPELQRGNYPDYIFVGPCLPERKHFFDLPPETLPDDGLPLAYVAMGTVYSMEAARMKRAILSLRDAGFSVLVSAGESVAMLSSLSGLPGIEIRPRVNQLSVLSHAKAFITHGGMSSTQEAMYSAVVPVFHPLQQEQRAIADVATGMRAGYIWDGECDLGKLALTAMGDRRAHAAVESLGKTLRKAGGVDLAVSHIKRYLDTDIGLAS